MDNLDDILAEIDSQLSEKNAVREEALTVSRQVVQYASRAIRAVHRHEWEQASATLSDAGTLVRQMNEQTVGQPDLYWTGYVQDAQKEYAEAHLTLALVRQSPFPHPAEIGVEAAAYLNALAEAASELRRYILDLVRHNRHQEADQLLDAMEEVYSRLIGVDYPHAITSNLRRSTDQLRGVLERTRGDVTVAMKQQELQEALKAMEERLAESRST